MRHTLTLATLLFCNSVYGDIVIESGIEQNNLIELYTSEGCSSCPPADQWLSALDDHPSLWEDLIPVAFHVDYWDYIGWKDRFAQPEFGDRQRTYATDNNVSTVYTPGLLSNGEEWRNFSWLAPAEIEVNNVGLLSADIGIDEVKIRFRPEVSAAGKSLIAYAALLGFGLMSDVRAGENAGRKLVHDFVVLDYSRTPMMLVDGSYEIIIPRPKSKVDARRFAMVFWVSKANDQAPLQAAGGWLDL